MKCSSFAMSRRAFLAGMAASAIAPRLSRAATGAPPNLIVILADDMGFSDIGCYGSEIATPNIDALAANGLRFTRCYNTARCCPTRACLLTGLYPHQTGIGHMTSEGEHHFDYGVPGYRGVLNRNCVTLGEALGAAGYRTVMTGKWHVGTARGGWPLDRGFDRYFGIVRGACNYFHPDPDKLLVEDDTAVTELGEDFYTTDAFTTHAIDFVRDTPEDTPFFLYLAYNAPHWPLNAWPEDIDRYRERYAGGWDALREERFARQRAMGLLDERWPLTPRDESVPAWESLPEARREELALRMAIYAAQVDRLDQNVGRLVAALKASGKWDNTVILFLSDNGGCAEGGNWGAGPAEELETKEGYWLSYGRGWANASNTPFRRYKHWVHEGGISTPLVAHWPGGIPETLHGSFVRQPVHVVDLMPTLLELAGGAYPETFGGNAIPPAEGWSFAPVLRGDMKATRPGPIFWEHEGNRAVCEGRWKLVSAFDPKQDTWELHDLETGRTETENVSASHPDLVEAMASQYEVWAARCGVVPWRELQARLKKKSH